MWSVEKIAWFTTVVVVVEVEYLVYFSMSKNKGYFSDWPLYN